jgi:hypothetical protein
MRSTEEKTTSRRVFNRSEIGCLVRGEAINCFTMASIYEKCIPLLNICASAHSKEISALELSGVKEAVVRATGDNSLV